MKTAYAAPNIQIRNSALEKAAKSLSTTYKDQFYVKLIGEINEVNQKQIQYYKETSSKVELVDKPLGDLIYYFVSQNAKKTDEEAKSLKRSLNLNEQVYFSIAVRAYADSKNWPEVA